MSERKTRCRKLPATRFFPEGSGVDRGGVRRVTCSRSTLKPLPGGACFIRSDTVVPSVAGRRLAERRTLGGSSGHWASCRAPVLFGCQDPGQALGSPCLGGGSPCWVCSAAPPAPSHVVSPGRRLLLPGLGVTGLLAAELAGVCGLSWGTRPRRGPHSFCVYLPVPGRLHVQTRSFPMHHLA